MVADARSARIAAHKANLRRYARLLLTQLTDTERAFIRRRIDEERRALDRLYAAPDEIAPHLAAAELASCVAARTAG